MLDNIYIDSLVGSPAEDTKFIIPEVFLPVLLIDRVRGRKCRFLVRAAALVGRFKEGFISDKMP